MASPCIEDSPSVNHEITDDGELVSYVIPSADGTIDVSAGVEVRFSGSSGLGTNANGLIVDAQSPGLAIDASGLAKVMTAAGAGWGPGAADDTVSHNFNVSRGSSTVIYAISQTASVAQSISTRVILFAYMSARVRTTWLGLGDAATNVNDEIGVQLQSNVDNAGWVTMNRFELVGNNQRTTCNLVGYRFLSWEDGTSHSVQSRALITGGIASATAIQGRLERSFYKGQVLYY